MLRRLAVLVAALAVLCAAALAEGPLCIVVPEVSALVTPEGTSLIEGEQIDDVFAVRDGVLYAAGQKGSYRLYDASGRPLGQTGFTMIDDQEQCLIFTDGRLFGAMDLSGEVLQKAIWTGLVNAGDGAWLALDSDPMDDRPDEIIRVEADGNILRTGVYTACGLSRVERDRMPYMNENGQYGAVNGRGEVVIQPQWRFIGVFENGIARVAGRAGVGVIDADGVLIIPAIHRWLEMNASMIAAQSETGVFIYAPDGETLVCSLWGAYGETTMVGDWLAVKEENGTSLYDANGECRLKSDFNTRFYPGTLGQVIASEGEWGQACQWLVNPDGSKASGRFQRLLPLCEGRYAFMEMSGTEYYSDDLGRLQWSWNYDSARWGLLDGAGKVLQPARYLEILALDGQRLLLRDESGATLSDLQGTPVRHWPAAEAEAPSGAADASGIE